MEKLNLPNYSFKIKSEHQRKVIFDGIRRKYVKLTPEEWVRQNFVQYLIQEKKCPQGLVAIEMSMNINRLARRSDVVVFNRQGKPQMIVECKASHIKITQDVFDQIARYNMKLRVEYLVVTNGVKHYCCKMNYQDQNYAFIQDIPNYGELQQD